MDKSILFLVATLTAVTCSAALPTMGRMIRPINASLTDELSIMSGMASTRNSAHTATSAVDTSNITTAAVRDISDSLCSGGALLAVTSTVVGIRAAPLANWTAFPTGGGRFM